MKFFFIVGFIIVQLLMVFTVNQVNLYKKEQLLNKKTKDMLRQYKSIDHYLNKIATTVFQGYINRENNIEAFANKDRDKLYDLLKNDYNYLKNIDILQVHFHLKNNSSFLRLHKPEI